VARIHISDGPGGDGAVVVLQITEHTDLDV
jgi:hypothetical protein